MSIEKEILGWLMDHIIGRVEWKYFSLEHGELLNIVLGVGWMLMLLANSLDMTLDVSSCLNDSSVLHNDMHSSRMFTDGYLDISRSSAYFGVGTGPVHLRYVRCSGVEHRLLDCTHNNNTYDDTRAWSVTCNNGEVHQ